MRTMMLAPRFTRMLPDVLFSSLCDVERKTVVEDVFGQETETWAQVKHLRNIPCAVAPVTMTGERQQQLYTPTEYGWYVLMIGDYSSITTRDRVTIDDVVYDVESVEVEDHGTMTRLRVSKVGV